MRRIVTISLAFFVSVLTGYAAGPHSYVGVKACTPCHKTEKQGKQQPIWQESAHAKAFATLKTPEAQKVAEKAGVKGPASEAEQCLKCHTTAAGVAAADLKPGFAKEDGVQCEACHGPGADYKTMTIMKDKAKAIEAGLAAISVQDGSAEKLCKHCHNPQSPTFKSFTFKENWAKIAHAIPKT